MSHNKNKTNQASPATPTSAETSPQRQRLTELVSQGNYEKAYQYLHANGSGDGALNDQGVCLMRLGRYEEAVKILRRLALKSDNISLQTESPVIYQTNFATALLLNDHAGGCLSLMTQIKDQSHPALLKLRGLIRSWESTMSAWQRFNWRWLGVEPNKLPVKPTVDLGDFEQVLVLPSTTPATDLPGHDFSTAV